MQHIHEIDVPSRTYCWLWSSVGNESGQPEQSGNDRLCKDWQPLNLDHYLPELSSRFEAAERQNLRAFIPRYLLPLKNFAVALPALADLSWGGKSVGEFRPQGCEGDELAFCSREYARLSEGAGRPVGAWTRPHSERFPGFSSPFPETLWRKVHHAAR